MPTALRSRVALLAGAVAFFLPVVASSPRGLTHLVTCRQTSHTPFTIVIGQDLRPALVTSVEGTRPEGSTLCGALALDLRASVQGPGAVRMRVFLTNKTPHPWRGTVAMTVGSLLVPLRMGRIGPGASASSAVGLHLLPGAHDLEGALLVGP
jgi:hypothetical protein